MQKVVQQIEDAGCFLWSSGNLLRFSSTENLSLGQLEFLKKHRQEICEYLQSTAKNDDGKIERPDNELPLNGKKSLLFHWVCKSIGVDPESWESLGIDKQLEIQSATNVVYHTLLNSQCNKCDHNVDQDLGCKDMAGLQIVCQQWDPKLVDWGVSCPLRPRQRENWVTPALDYLNLDYGKKKVTR